MIVGLYQCSSPAGDLDLGFATVETALKAAAAAGVGMLVMPEVFLPGYNSATKQSPKGWDGALERLGAQCAKYDIALTIGLPEFTGGTVYNSAFAIGADGLVIATYRKVQLFGPNENALYRPGEAHVVFDYQGTRFGLLICYDVEFPEHCRALARAGAEAILVPTANMMPFENVNQVMVPARAAENSLTVVYANYCGSEGDLDYVGLSTICGPDGYVLASLGKDAGLCFAEIPKPTQDRKIPLATQLDDYRAVKAP